MLSLKQVQGTSFLLILAAPWTQPVTSNKDLNLNSTWICFGNERKKEAAHLNTILLSHCCKVHTPRLAHM